MNASKFITLAGLLTVALITGAGSCDRGGGNGQPPPTTYPGCVPGQFCPGGGWNGGVAPGGPILGGPIYAAIDIYGRGQGYMQLNIGATNGAVAGQGYQGPVNISGTIQINASCGMWGQSFPSGVPQSVTGFGQWEANYGGTVGRLQAQLQMAGAYGVNIEPTLVYYGTFQGIAGIPAQQGFYMNPFGNMSVCGPFGPISAY